MNADSLRTRIKKAVHSLRLASERLGAFLRRHALTERGIVSIFLILLAIGIGFLDKKIGRDLDPDTGKNWWTLSFETRAPDSLSFAIENHSENEDFSYSVIHGKDIIDTGTVSVEKGARKMIPSTGSRDGRTTISVEASDGSKKSIYRER